MNKFQGNLLALMVIIVSMIGIYIFFIAESKESKPCFSKDGILNLEDWDWSKNSIIELNGEWKYYNNLLKEDLNDETQSTIRNVPDFWESNPDRNFSPFNYGTYTLKIIGLKPSEIYGLEMPDQVTAYALFANNKKIASNGIVSKDADSSVPQWKPMTSVFITNENGEVEFAMEISNFDYYRGGFWNSIKMGNVEDIFTDANKNKSREMFLFGTIFIIGLISLGLFFTYKRKKATLYFAYFCFCISFTILLTGQRLISDMISIFNWHILIRIEYLLGYLLTPTFGLFTINLFEVKAYKIAMKRFFYFLIICFFVITLIAPNYAFSAIMKPYRYGTILFSAYFLHLIFRAIKNDQVGAKLMLFAALGLLISIFHETFIRGPVSWVPFASLNFVICFLLITFQQFLDIIRKKDMLEMKAIIDPLTGLYNRTYLSQMEAQCFKEQKNQNRYVLFLDLDHFKSINDTFGHKIGDFILKETSKRLKNLLKNRGTIYRYGGDEIIIIINNGIEDEIINIAKKIIEIIAQPFAKEENNYKIGVSVGIASSNSNINNIEALIKNSDEAMYKAKKNGGNQYFLWSEENIKKIQVD